MRSFRKYYFTKDNNALCDPVNIVAAYEDDIKAVTNTTRVVRARKDLSGIMRIDTFAYYCVYGDHEFYEIRVHRPPFSTFRWDRVRIVYDIYAGCFLYYYELYWHENFVDVTLRVLFHIAGVSVTDKKIKVFSRTEDYRA